MKFTKMHGIGNDYIYVNGLTETVSDKPELARRLSDRHFGIGSDGIIFINPSDKADFEMEMYNSDGSRSEMCGNGIRCVAKYVYDHRLTDKRVINIETLAGIKPIEVTVDESTDLVSRARVNMGAPILTPDKVPCRAELFEGYEGGDSPVINKKLDIAGRSFDVTCVSMGNPHAIAFIDTPVSDFELEKYGPVAECHEAFPRRVNAEFVRVLDRNTVEMRVWERGSGETLACGTGATATAVAAILNGYTENKVAVKLLGGDLTIEWDGGLTSPAYMTGSATTVYEGEIL